MCYMCVFVYYDFSIKVFVFVFNVKRIFKISKEFSVWVCSFTFCNSLIYYNHSLQITFFLYYLTSNMCNFWYDPFLFLFLSLYVICINMKYMILIQCFLFTYKMTVSQYFVLTYVMIFEAFLKYLSDINFMQV